MPIEWRAATRELLLGNGRITYGMRVLDDDTLGHLYLGPALQGGRSYAHLGTPDFAGFTNRLGTPVALECPVGGSGDFRVPAVAVAIPADGSGVLQLRYVEHRVMAGKPAAAGSAVDVRGGGSGGRDRHRHAAGWAQRARGGGGHDDLPRPPRPGPQPAPAQRRRRAHPAAGGRELEPGPARRGVGVDAP